MQDIITKDNITAKTAAVCFFSVVDPYKVVTKIEDPYTATSQIAQTTLRSVLGQHELDELLSGRDKINAQLQAIIDRQTEGWGIKVNAIQVKDVEIPESMQRAMARQAEAERERRAKIVAAEGELQAAEKLSQAARVISSEPGAMQLRQLQTMVEVSAEKNSTLIFPIPIELLSFASRGGNSGQAVVQKVIEKVAEVMKTADQPTTTIPIEQKAPELVKAANQATTTIPIEKKQENSWFKEKSHFFDLLMNHDSLFFEKFLKSQMFRSFHYQSRTRALPSDSSLCGSSSRSAAKISLYGAMFSPYQRNTRNLSPSRPKFISK